MPRRVGDDADRQGGHRKAMARSHGTVRSRTMPLRAGTGDRRQGPRARWWRGRSGGHAVTARPARSPAVRRESGKRGTTAVRMEVPAPTGLEPVGAGRCDGCRWGPHICFPGGAGKRRGWNSTCPAPLHPWYALPGRPFSPACRPRPAPPRCPALRAEARSPPALPEGGCAGARPRCIARTYGAIRGFPTSTP